MLQGLHKTGFIKSQSGAISLIVLLIVVVTATTYLLGKLNVGIKNSVYSAENGRALNEAKDAIISWAVNHPTNPGTLPFPDRKEIVSPNYDGDADCPTGAVGTNLLLGKIPWRDYPAPCKDAAVLSGLSIFAPDKSGEQLWYAASKNLVYETPDYPFISPGLLSRTTDWITVRDANGTVISNRVAFVVIAPGPALAPYADCDGLPYAGQDRAGAAPDIGNYLDSVTIGGTPYSNADYDQDFILYPNSLITSGNTTLEKCDAFNDQLVYVTVEDLMDMLSKRVLNETAYALGRYHTTNGALPWLSPFSDPKSQSPHLEGQATSSSNDLVDTSVDFTTWGVATGDLVWNLTDGSRGTVTGVAATTLSIGAGLKFGTSNTFTTGDDYFVEQIELASALMGFASAGSAANILEDFGRNFEMLGIKPGDIIENLSDGSSGAIAEVNGDKITAAGLSGGSGNNFSMSDEYRIRSNTGQPTADTDANVLTLEDTNNDFIVMGVQVGDLVQNISNNSIGRVTAVNSATRITVDSFNYGTGVNPVSIIASDDVGVGSSTGNLGANNSSLRADGEDGGQEKRVLLKWDLTGIVPGTSISRAQLQLNLTETGAGYEIYAADTSTWTEASANYSDANNATSGTLLAAFTGSSTGLKQIDLNAAGISVVEGWIDTPASNTGFVIATDGNTDGILFNSSEAGSGKPTLNLTDEYYRISRYNSRDNTRIGLIPIHQIGEVFPTGFSIDWYAPEPGGGTNVATSLATDTTYTDALEDWAGTSSGYSGTISVAESDAKCAWISSEFINCQGSYLDASAGFLAGTATTGSAGLTLNDSNADFNAIGLKRGDLVNNTSEGSTGIVFNSTGTQITLVDITGCSPCVTMAQTDTYQVELATSTSNFIADSPSTSWPTRVYYRDTAGSFYLNESLVQVGDTLENTNGSASIGVITSINTGSNYVVHTVLKQDPPGYPDVYTGENVRIRHNFVNSRQYEFNVVFKGTDVEGTINGVRTRTVCTGYDASCTTAANNVTLKGDGTSAFVTIRDFEDGADVGIATNTLSVGGLVNSSLKVANLDFYLDDAYGDLPDWFVRNRWHQYILVAYSNGEAPGFTTCIQGTDCLTLNIRDGGGTVVSSRDDVRAMVMLAKDALSTQSWTAATASDYFDDNSNINLADDIFDRYPESATFNDLIRIAISCPTAPGTLCWSN